ncbi:DUF6093 family protein [Streptomyces sp. NPDC087525]|uniref:DUF6093 family protein n=1 Tax=Streptomyces sp. NPDC087525 TaxID=3365793 RepID=UPI00380E9349
MSALEAALAAGRAAAAELHRETVRLYRPSEGDFDWGTGADVPGPDVALYSGPARVKPERSQGQEVIAGERHVTLRDFMVSLPWSAPPPGSRPVPGDVIYIEGSPDARMVGLLLWVTSVQYGSTATVWRISAEDRS